MIFRKPLHYRWLAALSLTGILVAPHAYGAEPSRSTPPLLVQNDEAALLTLDCERILTTDTAQVTAARALGWRIVVPSNADGLAVFACPPHNVQQLQPVPTGRVAGIAYAQEEELTPQEAESILLRAVYDNATSQEGVQTGSYDDVKKDIRMSTASEEETLIGRAVRWALNELFGMLVDLGKTILGWATTAVDLLLSLSSFLDNTVVRRGWPWILGVTNLGFMIALLLIALTTALNLEIGGGWRRLLPRLLLAALLVNFSLVIGGAILDFSRVVMAIMPLILVGRGGVTQLDSYLLHASRAAELAAGSLSATTLGVWAVTASLALQVVVVWALAISFAVVAFGLLVRYIMLLILHRSSATAVGRTPQPTPTTRHQTNCCGRS